MARALPGPGLELERLDRSNPFFTSNRCSATTCWSTPEAEDGLDGWTVTEGIAESLTAGECNGVNPHSGSRYFAVGGLCTESDLARMHQDVDVSAEADSIDAGAVLAAGTAWMSDWSGSDIPAMRLLFLDEASDVIGETGWFEMPVATWTEVDIQARSAPHPVHPGRTAGHAGRRTGQRQLLRRPLPPPRQ